MDTISLLLREEMKENDALIFVSPQTHGRIFRVGRVAGLDENSTRGGGLCCLIYSTNLTKMQMFGWIEN